MKTAIYVRVSTKDQSLDSQLHTLQEYAKARKLDIVEIFTDQGVSGAKKKRPGLDRLMEAANKRKIEAVLVFRFDRFARSTKHLAMALDEFRARGIQFISYSENVDTTTAMGEAMFTIIGAMAQLERDIIRERVSAGLNAARAKGKRLGRPTSGKEEKIRILRKKGWSYRKIARELGVGLATINRVLAE